VPCVPESFVVDGIVSLGDVEPRVRRPLDDHYSRSLLLTSLDIQGEFDPAYRKTPALDVQPSGIEDLLRAVDLGERDHVEEQAIPQHRFAHCEPVMSFHLSEPDSCERILHIVHVKSGHHSTSEADEDAVCGSVISAGAAFEYPCPVALKRSVGGLVDVKHSLAQGQIPAALPSDDLPVERSHAGGEGRIVVLDLVIGLHQKRQRLD